MPSDGNVLDIETAAAFCDQLMFLDEYPRKLELREPAARHLQQICRGDKDHTPFEQAQILLYEVTSRYHTWKGLGWPGVRELFNSLFPFEQDEYSLRARQHGQCPECGNSGLMNDGEVTVRCLCRLGRLISDEEIARFNAPLPEIKLEPKPKTSPPIQFPRKPPQPAMQPITQEDFDKLLASIKNDKPS